MSIKLLGIHFHHTLTKSQHKTFHIITEKVEKRIEPLKGRSLSLKGRVLVTNSLLLSKLWYAASVLQIPAPLLLRLNSAIFTFIWKGAHKNPLKREVLYRRKNQGGLGLLEIASQALALLTKQLLTPS